MKKSPEALDLAIKLYLDLPFYKRWRIFKFYKTNGWDVTKEWENCVEIANKMVSNYKYFSRKHG